MSYELGDLLITRNSEEVGNDSPGYYNHCGIYIGNQMVVEAQGGDIGYVREINLNTFINNYPEIVIIRCDSEKIGNAAGIYARALVGYPYRKIASIFRNLRRKKMGENCVSVVRKAYMNALEGDDPMWRIPDNVMNDGMFKVVSRKPDTR